MTIGTVHRARGVALLLVLAAVSACGYTTRNIIQARYRKVSLPLFQNQTFWRDFEIDLTRQVQRELESRPGIFIVPPEEADIVLEGTIVDFHQRVLSEDDRDRVRESSATTTVRVVLRDPRTRDVIQQFEVTDRAEFFLARGENLATATSESFFDLARNIVMGLEEAFPRPSEQRASVRGE